MFDIKKMILDSVSANMRDIPKDATLEQMEAYGSEIVEAADIAFDQSFGVSSHEETPGEQA